MGRQGQITIERRHGDGFAFNVSSIACSGSLTLAIGLSGKTALTRAPYSPVRRRGSTPVYLQAPLSPSFGVNHE